jgi:hypothetical protein
MAIMNRNMKEYPLQKEGFPEKLKLTLEEGKTLSFRFAGCFYMDGEMDELFVSYRSFPWESQRLTEKAGK